MHPVDPAHPRASRRADALARVCEKPAQVPRPSPGMRALGRAAAPPSDRHAPAATSVRLRSAFRRGLVRRPRLARRLADEREASTVLLSAPPGYGKTSLLYEWAEHDQRRFAWIALGEQHDDAGRLLASLVRALAELEPVDRGLIDACRSLDSGTSRERLEGVLDRATGLVRCMGSTRAPAIVVLDDAHVLRSRGALRVLGAIAAAMPSSAKLAIASRTALPLPLGRLRAERALLELTASDLAMTADEAHALLSADGLALDRRTLGRLLARTEGWPAGLNLASLTLRSRPYLAAGAEVSGHDRAVAEYIQDEVLGRIPADARTFLCRSSVLDELSASLCDAVLERSDSGSMLRSLAASNLLLLPLDSSCRRFRCHVLLRETLRAELDMEDSALVAGLHARACQWFEHRGESDQAIEHAVAANDARRAGALLCEHAAEYLMQGRNMRVEHWLDGFTAAQIASSPALALAAAYAHFAMGELGAAGYWARAASEALEPTASDADTNSLAAGIALIDAVIGRDGPVCMDANAARAFTMVGEASPWRALACLLRGVARCMAGQRAAARRSFHEGFCLSSATLPLVESLCLAQLALLEGEDGDWEGARDRAERAIDLVVSRALGGQPITTLAFGVHAWVAGHQGRADDAKRDLAAAEHLLVLSHGLPAWLDAQTRGVMARACIRLADVARARALLAQAARSLRQIPEVPVFRGWLEDGWAAIDDLSAGTLAGSGSLTLAELRVLRFLPTHLSFREIAEHLHVSTNTVKTQAHAVYRKLSARSRSEAVAHAAALGLIDVSVV